MVTAPATAEACASVHAVGVTASPAAGESGTGFEVDKGPNGEVLVDVRQFSRRLPNEYGKLQKAARRWCDGHSCASDLDLARVSVEDAFRLREKRDAGLENAVMALIHSAIVTYGRVFDDSAKLRGNLPIVGKLSPKASTFHKKVMGLRHRAIAHFAGEGTHRPWAQDLTVIVLGSGTYQTFASANRAAFQADFAADFHAHLVEVCRIAGELANDRRLAFEQHLVEAWQSNLEIDQLLRSCLLDPAQLLGWGGPILGGRRSGRLITVAADPITAQQAAQNSTHR